jgi:Icc-related predicted phosphoesterase
MFSGRKISVLVVAGLSIIFNLVAQAPPAQLQLETKIPFRFVAYGDTRFTDPANTEAANPQVRQLLVQGIAAEQPAFISIGGDIAYNGDKANDWATYDKETAAWKEAGIPVYPALGNHDLHGDPAVSLPNYFHRYPDIHKSRFYSVLAGNVLLLTLDSSLDELSGPQGEWLKSKLDSTPKDVAFVVVVMHHPPYTSSSDEKKFGGGHSSRQSENALASYLEGKQKDLAARIVVFSGHVHNYERHEHGGVTYFVTGGGGAHAYPIERVADDPFQSNEVNYHYLKVDVDRSKMTVTMRRLEVKDGKPEWTEPDKATIVRKN